MKITLIYDNVVWDPTLRADWGFACLVETAGRTLIQGYPTTVMVEEGYIFSDG